MSDRTLLLLLIGGGALYLMSQRDGGGVAPLPSTNTGSIPVTTGGDTFSNVVRDVSNLLRTGIEAFSGSSTRQVI